METPNKPTVGKPGPWTDADNVSNDSSEDRSQLYAHKTQLALLLAIIKASGKVNWTNVELPPGRTLSACKQHANTVLGALGEATSEGPKAPRKPRAPRPPKAKNEEGAKRKRVIKNKEIAATVEEDDDEELIIKKQKVDDEQDLDAKNKTDFENANPFHKREVSNEED